MFKLHTLALLLGALLEIFLGRFASLWNPFDSIRQLIKYLDRALLGDELILLEPSKQKSLGGLLVIIVLIPVIALILFFTLVFYDISPILGVIFEAIASYFCLDARRLLVLGKDVADSFYSDGIMAMKTDYELLTGENGGTSDSQALTKKTITYIANEASDSVASPMFVMFLFGPVGGFVYRTIDIIDEIVAAPVDRYKYFGYWPAKVDRIIDFIPGRFSGFIAEINAKFSFGDFNGKNASFVHLRDKYKAISVFAGALEMSLKEDMIGDDDTQACPKDIRRAIDLLRNMCTFCLVVLFVIFLMI